MKFPNADLFDVGRTRGTGGIYIGRPPLPNQMLSLNDALLLAAWIVAAVNDDERWAGTLAAVRDVRSKR